MGVLQYILKLQPATCLHVGDQFLSAGNDVAARDSCPTIWITSPRETEKILEHILYYKLGLNKLKSNLTDSTHRKMEIPQSPTIFSLNKMRINSNKSSFDIYGGSGSISNDSDNNGNGSDTSISI